MIDDIKAHQIGPVAVAELQKTRLIEGMIDGKTGAIAAKEAGYNTMEQRTPYKLIPPDELRARFQQIAKDKGLTLDRIGAKIAEHLEARANQTIEGKQVTQSEAPDYKVQQKAIEQLTGLIGMQDAQKVAQPCSSITVSVTGAAADRLLAAFEDR